MAQAPSKRQIVFNWMMDDPEFATRMDGYWGGAGEVKDVDALIAALAEQERKEQVMATQEEWLRETHACCAHLNVEYKPIDNGNGTMSDRWVCALCEGQFWPANEERCQSLKEWCEAYHIELTEREIFSIEIYIAKNVLPVAAAPAPGPLTEEQAKLIAHDILGPREGVPCDKDEVWKWMHGRIPHWVFTEVIERTTKALLTAASPAEQPSAPADERTPCVMEAIRNYKPPVPTEQPTTLARPATAETEGEAGGNGQLVPPPLAKTEEPSEGLLDIAHGILRQWLDDDAGTPQQQRDRLIESIHRQFAAAVQQARLKEAKWWRHLVIMHDESYFAVEGDKRIAALELPAEGRKNDE